MSAQGQMSDRAISQQIIEETKKLIGLETHAHSVSALGQAGFHFRFRHSYKDHRKSGKIAERLPITIQLNVISIFLVYLIAIPCGIYSATVPDLCRSRDDAVFFFLYSLPSFWVAVLLIMLLEAVISGTFFRFTAFHRSGLRIGRLFPGWSTALASDPAHHLPDLRGVRLPLATHSRQHARGHSRGLHPHRKSQGLSERLVIFKHAFRNAPAADCDLLAFLLPAMFGAV